VPIVQLDTPNPLGQAIGTAAGYLAANPARKAAKEQQQYERTRQSEADKRAAQELANNTLEETDRHAGVETAADQAKREAAATATMYQTLGQPPAYDPAHPEKAMDYAHKAANYYAVHDLANTDAGKYWADQFNGLTLGYQRYTGGEKNVAGAGLDTARTKQIQNWRTIADVNFQHRMKELQATQNGHAQIAAANRAQAYALAQMREGAADARAQRSQDERMTIAEMTALNAANGQDMTRAYQTAVHDYDGQLKGWQNAQKQGATAVANDQTPPAGYGAAPPTFNFTMPQPGASSPTIVVVPMPQPDGTVKMVPQVVHGKPKQPSGAAKRQAAKAPPKSAAAAPPAAPPASGGNPIVNAISSFLHLGGGGGTTPAPSNGKVVNRADAIRIGAQRGLSPDAAIKDAQAHGYTVK
jgi:hypothetical protein